LVPPIFADVDVMLAHETDGTCTVTVEAQG
jgi:hypothetical protein